jgi:protein-disulfide isomerase
MRLKYGWLIMLVVVALLAAACGPQEGVQTLSDQATAEQSSDAVADNSAAAAGADPTEETTKEAASSEGESSSAELPVDEGDWHVLGSPDAPITMVEYSDFQ